MDKFGLNDGDIVVFDDWLVIYNTYNETNYHGEIRNAIVFYSLMNLRDDYYTSSRFGPRTGIGYFESHKKPRYATNQEKEKIFTKMKNEGAKWDNENKKVVFIYEDLERYNKL